MGLGAVPTAGARAIAIAEGREAEVPNFVVLERERCSIEFVTTTIATSYLSATSLHRQFLLWAFR